MISTFIVTVEETESGQVYANTAVLCNRAEMNQEGLKLLLRIKKVVDSIIGAQEELAKKDLTPDQKKGMN